MGKGLLDLFVVEHEKSESLENEEGEVFDEKIVIFFLRFALERIIAR